MDGDGTCDDLDDDRDGDGTDNDADVWPDDACADTDTDGDGKPDSLVTGCTSSLTEDMNDDSAQERLTPTTARLLLCTSADLTNGLSMYSDVVCVSWVNDGYADCNDGSDEGVDMTNYGPGSSEDVWTDAKEIACGTDPLTTQTPSRP